jgi:hypothetical protein
MNNLPMTQTDAARLPATYEAAQRAIAECDRIDECKNWADRAQALASYARQANDDSLRVMAVRIQARALRRAGELLKQIPPAPGARTDLQPHDGTVTRLKAAASAGLSDRQRVTALRVASIPEPDFDQAVESPCPPSATALAQVGTVRRADACAEVDPAIQALSSFAQFCESTDAISVASATRRDEFSRVRGHVHAIDGWLDRFVSNLPLE